MIVESPPRLPPLPDAVRSTLEEFSRAFGLDVHVWGDGDGSGLVHLWPEGYEGVRERIAGQERAALLRVLLWPAGLAAAGAALCCWGLALGGYWPVAFALSGPRVLPVAGATLAVGLMAAPAQA